MFPNFIMLFVLSLFVLKNSAWSGNTLLCLFRWTIKIGGISWAFPERLTHHLWICPMKIKLVSLALVVVQLQIFCINLIPLNRTVSNNLFFWLFFSARWLVNPNIYFVVYLSFSLFQRVLALLFYLHIAICSSHITSPYLFRFRLKLVNSNIIFLFSWNWPNLLFSRTVNMKWFWLYSWVKIRSITFLRFLLSSWLVHCLGNLLPVWHISFNIFNFS